VLEDGDLWQDDAPSEDETLNTRTVTSAPPPSLPMSRRPVFRWPGERPPLLSRLSGTQIALFYERWHVWQGLSRRRAWHTD
jgi:hypothetical protein